MARMSNTPPRDSAGRFVRRRRKAPGASSSTSSGAVAAPMRPSRRRGVGRLAVLSLAIVLGAVGFALHFLWVGALLLMAALWGALATERQRESNTVVLAEVVGAVVDEAKGVRETATNHIESPTV